MPHMQKDVNMKHALLPSQRRIGLYAPYINSVYIIRYNYIYIIAVLHEKQERISYTLQIDFTKAGH